jgi:hypothetical protein
MKKKRMWLVVELGNMRPRPARSEASDKDILCSVALQFEALPLTRPALRRRRVPRRHRGQPIQAVDFPSELPHLDLTR